MTTNYDPIAAQYKCAKQQPWRVHVEAFTLLRMIGDPTGKTVIDIACGEGFYTRMIRQRGAAKVTGVDLSEKMIGLAPGQRSATAAGDRLYRRGRAEPRGARRTTISRLQPIF
jgi:2-polyprenyl-3-methyl-5-hydroxy-6-metoxy-1,4-benzoquinol methylase